MKRVKGCFLLDRKVILYTIYTLYNRLSFDTLIIVVKQWNNTAKEALLTVIKLLARVVCYNTKNTYVCSLTWLQYSIVCYVHGANRNRDVEADAKCNVVNVTPYILICTLKEFPDFSISLVFFQRTCLICFIR